MIRPINWCFTWLQDQDIYVKNYNTKTRKFEKSFIKTALPKNSKIHYNEINKSDEQFIRFLKE